MEIHYLNYFNLCGSLSSMLSLSPFSRSYPFLSVSFFRSYPLLSLLCPIISLPLSLSYSRPYSPLSLLLRCISLLHPMPPSHFLFFPDLISFYSPLSPILLTLFTPLLIRCLPPLPLRCLFLSLSLPICSAALSLHNCPAGRLKISKQ